MIFSGEFPGAAVDRAGADGAPRHHLPHARQHRQLGEVQHAGRRDDDRHGRLDPVVHGVPGRGSLGVLDAHMAHVQPAGILGEGSILKCIFKYLQDDPSEW